MKRVLYLIRNSLENQRAVSAFIAVFLILYIPLLYILYLSSGVQAVEGSKYVLPVLGSDSVQYFDLAGNLSSQKCFALEKCSNPEIFRTPGYPFFVYIVSKFFGGIFSVVLLQSILAVLAGYYTYKILLLYVPPRWAIYTGLFFTIEPSVVMHSMIILSDIPYVFLILFSTYFFLCKPKNFYNLLYISAILGISVYIRPISMYILPIFLVLYIHPKYKERSGYVQAGFGILLFALIIIPWIVRNKVVADYRGFSTVTSYNIFYYNVPMYLSYKTGNSESNERAILIKKAGIESGSLFSTSSQEAMTMVSKEIIYKNLLSYAKFHIIKTASFFFGSSIKNAITSKNTFFSYDTDTIFSEKNIYEYVKRGDIREIFNTAYSSGIILLERMFWVAVFLLSLISVIFPVDRPSKLFMLALVSYFAVLTGPVSYVRYRLPAEPFMLILACISAYIVANATKEIILRRSSLQI